MAVYGHAHICQHPSVSMETFKANTRFTLKTPPPSPYRGNKYAVIVVDIRVRATARPGVSLAAVTI